MSIEQEFADKLVQYKHIIYKVCFMYADNKDDVNDLFKSLYSIYGSHTKTSGGKVRLSHGFTAYP